MEIINILQSRFFSHSPFRLVHDVTYQCNCKCIICERWKKSSIIHNELSTKEIFKMLDNAKKAAIVFYVVEGGEPLLRKDLPNILRYAKKIGLRTSVVTNGYHLKYRNTEIAPYTDSLIVSLDANDDLHDEMRELKGLRKRAIEGIRLCQHTNMNITINSVLCTENLTKINDLIELAQAINVPIIFQPMDIYKGYNEHLRPTIGQLQKTFQEIYQKKKEGYPIGNSYSYLEHIIRNKIYKCHAPKCYTYIEPNGNIVSCCDIIDKIWGNVKDTTFKEIFKSKEFKEFTKKMEKCNYCSVNAVVETSTFYSWNPILLLKKFVNVD